MAVLPLAPNTCDDCAGLCRRRRPHPQGPRCPGGRGQNGFCLWGRRAPGHAKPLLGSTSDVGARVHGRVRTARRRTPPVKLHRHRRVRRRGGIRAGRPSEVMATYRLVSRARPPGVEAGPPASPRDGFLVPIRAPVGTWALRSTCPHLPPLGAPPPALSAPPPPAAASLSCAQAPTTFGQLWRPHLSLDGTEHLRLPAPGCPHQHSPKKHPQDGL